jgi:hypothetical protein
VDVTHRLVAEDEGAQIDEDLEAFIINSVSEKTRGK